MCQGLPFLYTQLKDPLAGTKPYKPLNVLSLIHQKLFIKCLPAYVSVTTKNKTKPKTATTESYKDKHSLTIQSSNCAPGYLPNLFENLRPAHKCF